MKKILQTLVILLLYFNLSAQQQIPNGNFENWSGGEAVNWNSLPLIYTAEQSNESVQGNYAIKLVSQSVFGQFLPGLITLGEIDVNNQTLSGGTPYADRPDGISFFFKYQPSGIDTMFFGVFLTKWNTIDLQTDTIGITGYLNSDTYNSYTEVELPFIYNSQEIPDTLNIIFTSSGFNGNAGSSLIIDSLSMKNGTIVSPTLCFPADEITSSSFKAHWMTVPNAVSYRIDVSDNSDFSTFLTAYEDLNTGTDTFLIVNTANTGTYYYRVRVNYDSETSINSNTIEVLVEDTGVKNFISDNIKLFTDGNFVNIAGFDSGIKKIKVYNIEGKIIKDFSETRNKLRFSLPKPGIYIIEIQTKEKIIRKKINIVF